MDEHSAGVASSIIEKLGGDPCLLAIVVIVVGCGLVIMFTFRHQERMERIRVQQYVRAIGENKDGTN